MLSNELDVGIDSGGNQNVAASFAVYEIVVQPEIIAGIVMLEQVMLIFVHFHSIQCYQIHGYFHKRGIFCGMTHHVFVIHAFGNIGFQIPKNGIAVGSRNNIRIQFGTNETAYTDSVPDDIAGCVGYIPDRIPFR